MLGATFMANCMANSLGIPEFLQILLFTCCKLFANKLNKCEAGFFFLKRYFSFFPVISAAAAIVIMMSHAHFDEGTSNRNTSKVVKEHFNAMHYDADG